MDKNCVVLLRESLEKKVRILKEISKKNDEQADILEDITSSPDDLEENINAKDAMIQQIVRLDDGFEQMFSEVQAELEQDRELYADEIKRMQDLIREITDLSVSVQAQEKQNYTLATARFSEIKNQVKKVRQSQKAVTNYYHNMMKADYSPQFLDSKK